jgi:hypothetical protein
LKEKSGIASTPTALFEQTSRTTPLKVWAIQIPQQTQELGISGTTGADWKVSFDVT